MTGTGTPVDLIPPERQTLWRTPAVTNFAAGGTGAGLYLAAVLSAGFDASPALTLASWLAPVLVLGGFVAVAAEAGRPVRGPRVIVRVRTSWMSREAWLGGAFVALAGAEFIAPDPRLRVVAAIAAALFALAQGFIVRRARGISAWDVPIMPVIFVMSALVSGAGLLLVFDVVTGQPLGDWLLGAAMVLLVVAFVAWLTFVTWSSDDSFASGTSMLREGPTAVQLAGGGYVIPFLMVGLALAWPEWRAPVTFIAGALMCAEQIHAKAVLILKAGQLRAVTLQSLRLSISAQAHQRRSS